MGDGRRRESRKGEEHGRSLVLPVPASETRTIWRHKREQQGVKKERYSTRGAVDNW